MNHFRTIVIVCVVAIIAFAIWAAGPPPGTYTVPAFMTTNNARVIGTNGIGVSSNINTAVVPSLGTYVIDGSSLSNSIAINMSNKVDELTGVATNLTTYGWFANRAITTNFANVYFNTAAFFGSSGYNIDASGQFTLLSGTLDGAISDTLGTVWGIDSTGAGGFGGFNFVFDSTGKLIVAGLTNNGYFTNAGGANFGSAVTNWSTLRNKGAVANESTVTNTGAINNAAAVTNWNTVNNQDLSTNTVTASDADKKQVSIPNPTIGAGQPLIFNGTNAVFESIGDGWLISEEFPAAVITAQQEPWITLLAGASGFAQRSGTTNWGELVITNSFTAADRIGGVVNNATPTFVVTNTELWCFIRWQCRTKNTASISNTVRFGLFDTYAGAAGTKGIWIQAAGQGGVWEACTGNDAAGGVTNGITITVTADEWRNFAWHLDRTQTNVYFYSGNSASTMTIWCTNTINLPTANVSWAFHSRRMATQTSGAATNAIDHFKVWKRNLW